VAGVLDVAVAPADKVSATSTFAAYGGPTACASVQ